MVLKAAEIALGIGIEPAFKQLCNDGALRLERPRGNVHQLVKTLVEVCFILCKIRDPRQIDRHHADRAGRLAGAEEATGLFAQLPQIEP